VQWPDDGSILELKLVDRKKSIQIAGCD